MPIEAESPEQIGYDAIECNLSESSVTDFLLDDLHLSLNHLRLEYTGHYGKKELREMIVNPYPALTADDVLLTNGAAGALFIINTALLQKEDHLIVIRPNYATNLEVPKAIGCSITYIDLHLNEQWKIDIDKIKTAITSSTKLISITTPHNPTGMVMNEDDIKELASFAEEKNIYLLVDETYRDACFITPYPPSATVSKNVITVSSLSKAYGLPGLRMGWIVTQNKELMHTFLCAKEMIYITNSVVDEELAYRFFLNKEKLGAEISMHAREKFDMLCKWLAQQDMLEYVIPQGGVVCFAKFRDELKIDTDKFYSILFNQYKTMVGPGHWFDMPDTYMRIGFGWPAKEQLHQGLMNILLAAKQAL